MWSGVNYLENEPVLEETADAQTVSHRTVVAGVGEGETGDHGISSQAGRCSWSYRWISGPQLILALTHMWPWLHTEESRSPACFLFPWINTRQSPLSQPLCVSDQRQTKHIRNMKPSQVLCCFYTAYLQYEPQHRVDSALPFCFLPYHLIAT